MADLISKEKRSKVMSRIRSKDTTPEMTVRRIAHGMGFRYRLHDPRLPGKPDLVFSRFKKLIQVHGCFWHQHGCPNCRTPKSRIKYWWPKLKGNQKRDAQNEKELRALGWGTLTLWECEVEDSLRTARRIAKFLQH